MFLSSVRCYLQVFLGLYRANREISNKRFFGKGRKRQGKCTLYIFIIHQTHYEKSDWSRAFNQFTIACELDMINAISAADIAFIMSSSTSAWLPSPLECSPQRQNGWTLRFCFWGWIMDLGVGWWSLKFTGALSCNSRSHCTNTGNNISRLRISQQ